MHSILIEIIPVPLLTGGLFNTNVMCGKRRRLLNELRARGKDKGPLDVADLMEIDQVQILFTEI